MSKPAKTMRLWAPIITSSRAEWVSHLDIRFTRRDAKHAYLEGFDLKHHKELLKNVRFARVIVSIESTS